MEDNVSCKTSHFKRHVHRDFTSRINESFDLRTLDRTSSVSSFNRSRYEKFQIKFRDNAPFRSVLGDVGGFWDVVILILSQKDPGRTRVN